MSGNTAKMSALNGLTYCMALASALVLGDLGFSVANDIKTNNNCDLPQKMIQLKENKYTVVDNRGYTNKTYNFVMAGDCADSLEAIRTNQSIGVLADNGKNLMLTKFDKDKNSFVPTTYAMKLQ